ncbi:hypothetical protein, partial [Clostridium colicanis]|uniref:hypothetical protein n=1 Tax=Clostridium colicanis TaxID=179628 RepID=UPI001A9A3272
AFLPGLILISSLFLDSLIQVNIVDFDIPCLLETNETFPTSLTGPMSISWTQKVEQIMQNF